MKMNVRLLPILLLAFGFAACTVDDDEDVVSDVSVKKETTLSAVTISGASSISYNGTASLSAVATAEESTTISYTWSITSGDAYASLSPTSGETVTLTANNTTDSKQSISIKVVASDGIGSCENTHEVKT